MNFLLGEARFYFAQCVFNTSCHYAAYDRYEKERNKRHNIALTISSLSIISLCLMHIPFYAGKRAVKFFFEFCHFWEFF